MRPVSLSVTGVGNSAVCPTDYYVSPFNIALNIVVTGTITYTVQYTFDDVYAANFNPATANWTNHPSLTAQTATKDSNIAYPVTGIRLTTSAGTGTAALTIIQAGGGL
ncbi:hypothetical protein UFOVP118_81 [uncultured Caudovirales phage]|uniref:Uncharacterized protein n=1 Tax=uncultured Caudovirales phage TaxID=2100421 RepID=A0A6J5L866_9CAUD|nr:hypothetical protein UFOVP118_81 [uncultured Caudovirales phage]